MREAEVKAVLIDPQNGAPVIILRDRHSSKVLPIWIGQAEAISIATVLQKQPFPRPLSHDLMKSLLDAAGAKLEKVVISDLKENTFYATIYLRTADGQVKEIDARPSDSVALALRTSSPIYISEEVFAQSAIELPVEELEQSPADEKQKFEEFVDKELNLSEFKRYID
ncbi:bifunctional nuclease family protein [Candidatus Bipolaricaulota sp. J31]